MKSKKSSANDELERVLQQIYKLDVALEPDHATKRRLVMCFLTDFKDYCFKNSAMFKKFFQHFYLTGSYFEGLRVKEATEFDVNVAFNLPFNELSYLVKELYFPTSYATLKFRTNTDFKEIPFFDSKGFLLGKNILKWFQSLLDSFLEKQNFQFPGVLMTKTSNSGPARTIKVLYKTVWISIDLVPVFSLNVNHLTKQTMHPFSLQIASEKMDTCYLVPKPLKPELACQVPSHMHDRVWRIHFAEAEKFILGNKKNLKRVIKLVKALRDKEDWPLPSYFLKVVAFWLVKSFSDEHFWNEESVSSLFLLFLEALEDHLAVQQLGNIFYPSFNLFHSLHVTALRNLQVRIKKIIQQLIKEPLSAFVLFKVTMLHHLSPAPSLLC